MKKISLISSFLLLFMLASCAVVIFESPLPQNVKDEAVIPAELRGIYTTRKGRDTLWVGATAFIYHWNGGERKFSAKLSERTRLRKYQDLFVLNNKGNGMKHWQFVVIKQVNANNIILSMPDVTNGDFAEEIKAITPVKKIIDGYRADMLVVNPDQKQFDEIMLAGIIRPIVNFERAKK